MDPEETLAVSTAYSIAVLVLDNESMISVGYTNLAEFVFELGKVSFGLMEYAGATRVDEIPRGLIGVFICAGFDFDTDATAEAAGEGVEEGTVGGWFGSWLVDGRWSRWFLCRKWCWNIS